MDGTAGVEIRSRRGWVAWAIALLSIVAVAITVAASMFHAHDSAALYRFWSSLPGIVDICGTPTLVARAIPPALVLIGMALTFFLDASRRTLLVMRVAGVVLAAALAFAVMQNAAIGRQLCIVD